MYLDVAGKQLRTGRLRKRERVWDVRASAVRAQMAIADGRVAGWVRVWIGAEAFELLDQVEGSSVDGRADASALLYGSSKGEGQDGCCGEDGCEVHDRG